MSFHREIYLSSLRIGGKISKLSIRKEEYTPPPPPAYVEFSGNQTRIGGDPVINPQEIDLGFNKDAEKPKVDSSKPTGRIQVRFHNGERVVLTVNTDLPVSELYNYVFM